MKRPDFVILGAAKCGTTSLYAYLGQHPDVFLSCTSPSTDETFFFETEYERGWQYYWDRYCQGWNGEKVVGASRAFNLLLPFVTSRIRESLPKARLIAVWS